MRLLYAAIASALFIAVLLTAQSCAYTKKEVVQTPCVISDTISYAKHIAPIINLFCSDCHSAASPVSGILLDNYDGLRFYANNGYLYGVITHASGYKPMPEGGVMLSDCNIAKIKKWIDKGTPQ